MLQHQAIPPRGDGAGTPLAVECRQEVRAMRAVDELKAVLIDALLCGVTQEQAGRAVAELGRAASEPGFAEQADEDEEAAAWLAGVLAKLQPAAWFSGQSLPPPP